MAEELNSVNDAMLWLLCWFLIWYFYRPEASIPAPPTNVNAAQAAKADAAAKAEAES